MTEILQIEDLTVSFGTSAGRVKDLNNVSLSIAEGEVHCVLGESPFLPRCFKARNQCRAEPKPKLREIEVGHHVSCYNPIIPED